MPINLIPLYEALPAKIGELAGAFAADALGVVSATATTLFDVTLVLIIAFLMLIDGDTLWSQFTALLSEELRSEAELLRMSADRGVLSVFSGLVVIIPFFGPLLAMVPVLAITFLGAPDRFIAVLVLTIALQQVALNVVSPRIMSRSIGIHPIFVFLALLLGSRLAGFWGLVLAVPVAGVINTFVRYFLEVTSGRRQRIEAAALMEEAAPLEIAK